MIASRDERNKSSWRSSRGWLIVPPNSESRRHKESRTAQSGNAKTQEDRHQHRAFLQDRILVQIKSHRSINDFQILHGRPIKPDDSSGQVDRSEEISGCLVVACGNCPVLLELAEEVLNQ